jgi:hypothetical protein
MSTYRSLWRIRGVIGFAIITFPMRRRLIQVHAWRTKPTLVVSTRKWILAVGRGA